MLERLAHCEQHHQNLAQQLDEVTQERDALQTRLQAARSRVDALLEYLPAIDVTEEIDAVTDEASQGEQA